MVFERGQHVAFKNVGGCWTNMLASFEQALRKYTFEYVVA